MYIKNSQNDQHFVYLKYISEVFNSVHLKKAQEK